MSWWIEAQQQGREAFDAEAARQWETKMRFDKLPMLTSEDVPRKARKFDAGVATQAVREARRAERPEADAVL